MKTYVVFVGKNPGIYRTWKECKAQVHRYPGAIHKSYSTYQNAVEAYEDYKNNGVHPYDVGNDKWYVVLVGRNPGVYEKWTECEQNVKGFNDAVYFACDNKASAIASYNECKPMYEVISGMNSLNIVEDSPTTSSLVDIDK